MTRRICSALAAVLLALAFCQFGVTAPSKTPAPPLHDETKSSPRQTVWEEMLYAGVNERYWSTVASEAGEREFWFKVLTAVLGLSAVTLPLIFRPTSVKSKYGKVGIYIFQLLNVVAFGVSIVVLFDNSANYNQLSAIHKQWVSMKTQWETLYRDRTTLPEAVLASRVDAILAEKTATEIPEPPEKDHNAMHLAWLEEMHARNIDPDFIAQVEKNRGKTLAPTAD